MRLRFRVFIVGALLFGLAVARMISTSVLWLLLLFQWQSTALLWRPFRIFTRAVTFTASLRLIATFAQFAAVARAARGRKAVIVFDNIGPGSQHGTQRGRWLHLVFGYKGLQLQNFPSFQIMRSFRVSDELPQPCGLGGAGCTSSG